LSTLIEPAVVEDAEAILALQKLAYQTEAALYGDDIPPLRQTLGELRDDIATGMVLKLIEDGHVIGSVRATIVGDTGHIGRLIVHPKAQRRGFGSMLMAAIEERCTTCRRFELFTGDRRSGNLRLYQRLVYRAFRREALARDLIFVNLEKWASQHGLAAMEKLSQETAHE
jgi:GNAT superfamily N-acetyltransferase